MVYLQSVTLTHTRTHSHTDDCSTALQLPNMSKVRFRTLQLMGEQRGNQTCYKEIGLKLWSMSHLIGFDIKIRHKFSLRVYKHKYFHSFSQSRCPSILLL